MHASDYMVYACLQMGQDDKAHEIIDEMTAVTGFNPDRNTGAFALAASQARYMVERGDWNGAAQLAVRPSKFAYVDAISYFTRALGAARSGNPQAAQPDIDQLAELRNQLRLAKDAYWADQVDIQWQVATAWVLDAEGSHVNALKLMSAAADAEDRTEKATVYMLLGQDAATDALAAFETTLRKEPNRLNATAGAAKAAAKIGDAVKARRYYASVVELTRGTTTKRADVVDALAFMARR